MKTYLNPQPYAVKRANKIEKHSEDSMPLPEEKIPKSLVQKSDKEIYETESEEQAWKDVLKKDEF
ncbi:MAG: hypothetical protein H0U70_02120 [Tatlockia sp.]|nr:hypothetical protein [Tatlockia sp.]